MFCITLQKKLLVRMIVINNEMTAIYINIPFCKLRCSYCHYVSNISFGHNTVPNEYFSILLNDLEINKHCFANKTIQSLYFGGGTPSLLSDEQLQTIFNLFNRYNTQFAEVSIELHPRYTNFDIFVNNWFNRYSIGIQSLQNETLKKYNRLYSNRDALDLIQKLKGRENTIINVDFVFQTKFDLTQLDEIAKYKPNSITIYPDTNGRGIERIKEVYSTLDRIREYFQNHSGFYELGKSKYIFIQNGSKPSNYSKIQNEFLGNIIGIGHNAISDINDGSQLTLYNLQTGKISHKNRYTNGRRLKALLNAASVGVTLKMIRAVDPDFLHIGLFNTLSDVPVENKNVQLNENDLVYIPEYNYKQFYDYVFDKFGESHAKIFLDCITHFDRNLSDKDFFSFFLYRIDNITQENLREYSKGLYIEKAFLKKEIPNVKILIEGIDGSGKDTFAALLSDALKKRFFLSKDKSISIMGEPMSDLPRGKESKQFIEERIYTTDSQSIIEALHTNRKYCEAVFMKNKGISICIRGFLTCLATLKAVFNVSNSVISNPSIRYDYLIVVSSETVVAEKRIATRKCRRQWRESLHWLNYFKDFYETYEDERLYKKKFIIQNNSFIELMRHAELIADRIYFGDDD